MQLRECRVCGFGRPSSSFYRNSKRKDGLDTRCKDCERVRKADDYRAHASAINERRRELARLPHNREYQSRWAKERRRSDPSYRLKKNLRCSLWSALSGHAKTTSVLGLLGCSLEELQKHLESQFQPGMSWDNYGRGGWEVDHIKPCASFDLSQADQQRMCFHWTNLQPLWGPDNWKKGAR